MQQTATLHSTLSSTEMPAVAVQRMRMTLLMWVGWRMGLQSQQSSS